MWNPLPFRDTLTGSLPGSSVFGAPLRMWVRRACCLPLPWPLHTESDFLGPLSLWVWALVQCCCCLGVGLARTDVRTCLLILVWLINHHQPTPPTAMQVLQAPSVSDSLMLWKAEGSGAERHLCKGHRSVGRRHETRDTDLSLQSIPSLTGLGWAGSQGQRVALFLWMPGEKEETQDWEGESALPACV